MSNAIANSNKAAQDAAKQSVQNMGAMASNAFVQGTQALSDKLNDFGLPVEALVDKRQKAVKWVSDNKFRVIEVPDLPKPPMIILFILIN